MQVEQCGQLVNAPVVCSGSQLPDLEIQMPGVNRLDPNRRCNPTVVIFPMTVKAARCTRRQP
jgi:hypothetical protein